MFYSKNFNPIFSVVNTLNGFSVVGILVISFRVFLIYDDVGIFFKQRYAFGVKIYFYFLSSTIWGIPLCFSFLYIPTFFCAFPSFITFSHSLKHSIHIFCSSIILCTTSLGIFLYFFGCDCRS